MAEKKQVRNVNQPLGPSMLSLKREGIRFALWDPYWYFLGSREGTCLDSALWMWQVLCLRLGLKENRIR